MRIKILCFFAAAIFLSACSNYQTTSQPDAAASSAPDFEIEQIKDNLYRARSNNHYTTFLVTSEGTILSDPTTPEFAQWLKTEIANRFDSTVRYVLYTHHHWDHASGGAVFADTAIFVGHENMVTALQLPLPGNYISADKNADGVLARDEVAGGLANVFDQKDSDGNGELTGVEINQDIVVPTKTYSDKYNLTLGDSEVQMVYSGVNHSDDGSIIYFVNEKAIFNADLINIKRLPFGLRGKESTPWIDSIDVALSLDADTIIPGHGVTGNRQDLIDYREYFNDLRESVGPAVHAGMSLEEILETVTMDKYSDWQLYDRMTKPNMTEMYERITED